MIGFLRVSRRRWYDLGGFANPRCVRRSIGAYWRYFIRID